MATRSSLLRVAGIGLLLAAFAAGGPPLLRAYQTSCRTPLAELGQPVSGSENGEITVAAVLRDGSAQQDGLAFLGKDGRFLRFLESDSGADSPSWSRDGGMLVWSAFPNPASASAAVLRDMQTNAEQPLSHSLLSEQFQGQQLMLLDVQAHAVRQLTTQNLGNSAPAWSQERDRLVFVSELATEAGSTPGYGNRDLFVFEQGASEPTALAASQANEFSPSISPDGMQIVFVSDRAGGNDIFVMSPTGLSTTQLTSDAASEVDPAWSPDGQWLVFAANRGGQWDLYTMRADGSNQCQLTNDAALDRQPVWSPDGRSVLYVADETLRTVTLDGSAPHDLPTDPRLAGLKHPTWQAAP